MRLTRTDLVDGFTSPSAVDTKVVFEVWARARSDRSRWALTSTSCAPDAKAACSSLAVDTTVISASAFASAAGLSMPAFESCRAVREGSRSCPLVSSPNCTHHDHHMTDLVGYRLGWERLPTSRWPEAGAHEHLACNTQQAGDVARL